MIDAEVDSLLVAHYNLLQLCVAHGDKEEVDKAWSALVRRTTALNSMRSQLMMESSRWKNSNRRLQMLNTLSLTLITQAAETFLIQNSRPDYIPPQYRLMVEKPASTVEEVHKRMKVMRRVIGASGKSTPVTLASWVGTATEYLLLLKGIKVIAGLPRWKRRFCSARW